MGAPHHVRDTCINISPIRRETREAVSFKNAARDRFAIIRLRPCAFSLLFRVSLSFGDTFPYYEYAELRARARVRVRV